MNSIYEEIRIALHGVWLRRWLALAVAWGVCLAGWLVISTIPNKYESKASVFVQTQSLLPDKLGITPAERKNDIDGITQTLMSAENLEKIVRGTDLVASGATPAEIASQIAGLRKNIGIVAKQDNLFEISASAGYGGFSNGQMQSLPKTSFRNCSTCSSRAIFREAERKQAKPCVFWIRNSRSAKCSFKTPKPNVQLLKQNISDFCQGSVR